MKRFFLICSLFLITLSPSLSSAQENISVRLGDRGDFARLVFGWKKGVTYTTEQQKEGTLLLTFNVPSTINSIDASSFAYIKEIRTLSENPLTIKIVSADGSSFRDFKIGNRVIVDIYKPDGFNAGSPKETNQTQKTENQSTAPEKVKESAIAENTQDKTEQNKPDSKNKTNDGEGKVTDTANNKKMPAVPPSLVLIPEKLNKKRAESGRTTNADKDVVTKKKESVNEKIENAIRQEEHVVSIRSTQATDVAVFENFGRLWFVIDTQASFVTPELSTSKPSLFSKPTQENMQNASAYSMSLPEEYMSIKATGSGLIWNIIMGDVNETDSVDPYPQFSDARAGKGGKLIWPFKYIGKVLDVPDPVTGQMIKVVTVNDSTQNAGHAKSYVDFDLLRSPVGLAISPKVDDLIVEVTDKGVEIFRPAGLHLAPEKEVEAAQIFANQQRAKQEKVMKQKNEGHSKGDNQKTEKHIKTHGTRNEGYTHGDKNQKDSFFKFNDWMMKNANDSLAHKKTILLSTLPTKSDAAKVEDLITLGKMFLSYGRGAEALGFFDFASDELPELTESPEFKAFRGVAKALDWKSAEALSDLLHPKLDNEKEVKYWRSYVLADLGDWRQAASFLPDSFQPIYNYPHNISGRLALRLAEVALRDGKVNAANELITLVEHHKDELLTPFEAYLRYLKGEASRQKGKIDNAKEIWADLSEDKDDLYRTKSALALAILKSNENEINNGEKIDALERLRYAWRGDELEAQVKYWLGDAYFKKNDYLKGLHTMRDGASVAAGSALGERIAGDMSKAFTTLFLEDKLEGVTPLDAVALYEEFSELTPLGEDGNKLMQVLAEHLVKADLLPRAAKILRHQVDHRLEGEDKIKIAIRLAALEIMDKHPQGSVNALAKATNELRRISNEETKNKYARQIGLLKIKAYLQNRQYGKALSLLEKMPEGQDVNRLRADITWQAGYWNDAADAIHTIMMDENMVEKTELTDDDASMILNRAVALSLDNDRLALANLRQRYIQLMKDTNKARQFEVITRPRKDGGLADRETLLSIVSEVDMFKDMMDNLRKGEDLPAHN